MASVVPWVRRLLCSRLSPGGNPGSAPAGEIVGISRRSFLRGAAAGAIVMPSTRTIVDLAANTWRGADLAAEMNAHGGFELAGHLGIGPTRIADIVDILKRLYGPGVPDVFPADDQLLARMPTRDSFTEL